MLGVYFVAQNLYGYTVLVAPLPCVVYQFHIFAKAAFAAPTRACALDEAVDVDISPAAFDEDFYLAARTTTTDPRAQTLALRPRLGLVLWGLAGLEERPERGVVLPEGLSIVLAPGPRRLARVDDGRAGLHLLVLSVGETRRVAIHTSNLKHVPRRRRRLPSQMRRPRPRDPLRAHRSRAETGARRSPAYRRGYVR